MQSQSLLNNSDNMFLFEPIFVLIIKLGIRFSIFHWVYVRLHVRNDFLSGQEN